MWNFSLYREPDHLRDSVGCRGRRFDLNYGLSQQTRTLTLRRTSKLHSKFHKWGPSLYLHDCLLIYYVVFTCKQFLFCFNKSDFCSFYGSFYCRSLLYARILFMLLPFLCLNLYCLVFAVTVTELLPSVTSWMTRGSFLSASSVFPQTSAFFVKSLLCFTWLIWPIISCSRSCKAAGRRIFS